MQVTVHCALWFCDIYQMQCPECYSCMASIVVDHHFLQPGTVLKRNEYLDGPELCTVLSVLNSTQYCVGTTPISADT